MKYKDAKYSYDGHIVHLNGPYLCGHWLRSKIFLSNITRLLMPGKMVAADNGYCTALCVASQNEFLLECSLHTRLQARHEVCNIRLECFNILHDVFRHNVPLHLNVFHAVPIVVLLANMFKKTVTSCFHSRIETFRK